jgi:DNA-binding NarL/FixJ family response regulator
MLQSLPRASRERWVAPTRSRVCCRFSVAAPSGTAPNCLIIDEHPVVRQGVQALLAQAWPGAEVAAVRSLDSAIDTGALDVVIVDPWRSGEEMGKLFKRLGSELSAPIVVFTGDGGAHQMSEALKAGVKGYVRKDSPPGDLIRAIDAVRLGEFYVDPVLSSSILVEEGDRTLSARQRQILQMLADGVQTDGVAEELRLSTETVRTHTKRILAKLEASTRSQAVAIGLRHGLID